MLEDDEIRGEVREKLERLQEGLRSLEGDVEDEDDSE
jgi:hypothetical protein